MVNLPVEKLCINNFLCPIQICAVNMNISKDICDTIQQHKEIQVEVQKYASELSAYNEIIQGKGKMYAIKHHYEINQKTMRV